jgi:hypothetical protein
MSREVRKYVKQVSRYALQRHEGSTDQPLMKDQATGLQT